MIWRGGASTGPPCRGTRRTKRTQCSLTHSWNRYRNTKNCKRLDEGTDPPCRGTNKTKRRQCSQIHSWNRYRKTKDCKITRWSEWEALVCLAGVLRRPRGYSAVWLTAETGIAILKALKRLDDLKGRHWSALQGYQEDQEDTVQSDSQLKQVSQY
jgi:hypothetical protein